MTSVESSSADTSANVVVGNTPEEAEALKKQIEKRDKMWNMGAQLIAVVCLIIILIITVLYMQALDLIRGSYLDESGNSWLLELDGVRLVARSPRTSVDICISDGGWFGISHIGGVEFDAIPEGLVFANGTFWRRIG